ncbi:MAG: GIY-YIG nuclease family protein [Alphaproteobacteria bacterium]|nr:GIY-YIG nuclease family protein [Alphaproteobacteria bacterium]
MTRNYISVYIMANQPFGTIYIGVTNDLYRRAYEHRMGLVEGFTQKYGCKLLVWYEQHQLMTDAIVREKFLKKRLTRNQKFELIAQLNPDWDDLYPRLAD